MHNSLTGRLVLAVVLGTLSGTIAHADTTTPPPSSTPQSVTGGDPVPTSPHIVTVILTLLQVLR
jgi:hypothetical protein